MCISSWSRCSVGRDWGWRGWDSPFPVWGNSLATGIFVHLSLMVVFNLGSQCHHHCHLWVYVSLYSTPFPQFSHHSRNALSWEWSALLCHFQFICSADEPSVSSTDFGMILFSLLIKPSKSSSAGSFSNVPVFQSPCQVFCQCWCINTVPNISYSRNDKLNSWIESWIPRPLSTAANIQLKKTKGGGYLCLFSMEV